jgi:hypothetical protein
MRQDRAPGPGAALKKRPSIAAEVGCQRLRAQLRAKTFPSFLCASAPPSESLRSSPALLPTCLPNSQLPGITSGPHVSPTTERWPVTDASASKPASVNRKFRHDSRTAAIAYVEVQNVRMRSWDNPVAARVCSLRHLPRLRRRRVCGPMSACACCSSRTRTRSA